jgi:hypothetical protein
MRLSGARALRINGSGALVVKTGVGDVALTAPFAYQEQGGVRRPVKAVYALRGHDYGFWLGDYDPRLPLVIDPLLQATYLGGSLLEDGYALAIHPISGDVYVAGLTTSTNFPGTAGGAQTAKNAGFDAYLARLNSTLTTLTQATYIGGNGDDYGQALAINPTSGEVYLAGPTTSTNFPGTTGGLQSVASGGGADGFVARLNAALTTLIQATYLGGSGDDFALGLAIQPASGDVYVSGYTSSANFPGTTGGAQATHAAGGGYDGFVARLNPFLTALGQATYLGGSGVFDAARLVAIHPLSGDIYVAGDTTSTDLPGTAGAAQPASAGLQDAFVARLNASLTTLARATYLGGNNQDYAFALGIHPLSGDVYLAGETLSSSFPGTSGGAQAARGTLADGFVARMDAALTTLIQATYLGGFNDDSVFSLAFHPTSGDVYVSGFTASSNFPGATGGVQAVYGGGASDAFVARLTTSLRSLVQSTYLGGGSSDFGRALAIHPVSGDVYLAGGTDSTDFPGTAGGAQVNSGGSRDALVARLSADLQLPPPTSTPTSTPTNTPTSTPTRVPVNVPTLSPEPFLLLAVALVAAALLLIRKSP